MNRLSKDDLAQMNQDYLLTLNKEKLVEVAGNLHALAVEQLERLEKNSSNSSKPPSSDSFYQQQVEQKDSEQCQVSETQNSTTEEENYMRKNLLKRLKIKDLGRNHRESK